MERQEQIDFGERLLVAGVMTILVVEALFTILSLTLWYSLPRLLLSVAGGVLILILGAWLYSGSRRAWWVALGWVVLEAALVLTPLLMLLLHPGVETQCPFVRDVGVPYSYSWLLGLKLLVYVGFVMLLLISVNVRAFLDSRSEGSTPGQVMAANPGGPPTSLTEQQTSLFQSLADTFQGVGLLAVVAGAGLMVYETTTAPLLYGPDPLVLLEGLVLLILGLMLLLPPGALSVAGQGEPAPADLDQVFRRLGWLCVGILAGGLVFLGVALARLSPLYS